MSWHVALNQCRWRSCEPNVPGNDSIELQIGGEKQLKKKYLDRIYYSILCNVREESACTRNGDGFEVSTRKQMRYDAFGFDLFSTSLQAMKIIRVRIF